MKTDNECIEIEFNSICKECDSHIDGVGDDLTFTITLPSLIQNGAPVCYCGADYVVTGESKIKA